MASSRNMQSSFSTNFQIIKRWRREREIENKNTIPRENCSLKHFFKALNENQRFLRKLFSSSLTAADGKKTKNVLTQKTPFLSFLSYLSCYSIAPLAPL